jgi:hypothetical protein
MKNYLIKRWRNFYSMGLIFDYIIINLNIFIFIKIIINYSLKVKTFVLKLSGLGELILSNLSIFFSKLVNLSISKYTI